MKIFRGVITLGAVVGFCATATADVPARPTFTKDVLPILQENCQDCHRPKPVNMSGLVAPFSLTTYEETRPWAKAIAKAVQSEYMPPWFATSEFHGVFRNERTLTDDEKATILKWVNTGATKGNPADAPEARTFQDTEWYLGEPDLIVPLPEPVWVGDDVEDWQPDYYVTLTEDILPEDRWIRTIECQPGSNAVHHIVVFNTEPGSRGQGGIGRNIGGLAPGAEPSLLQDGYGIYLETGSTLRLNMHYHKEAAPGSGVWDQSKVGFFFYPKDAEVKPVIIEPIGSFDFEVPPHKKDWIVGMARTFERPFTVLNYLPHMHLRGTAAEYRAYFPDGREETLLNVPRYDYNWQLYYEYPEPRQFPAGTRIEVKLKFDNSQENESNPDPSEAVRFGLETTDEMAFGWMYYSYSDQEAIPTASD